MDEHEESYAKWNKPDSNTNMVWLMKMKEESEKAGLKLNNQKMKIMASGPITSWQTDGKAMGTVRDFTFLDSKSLQMVTVAMKLKEACSLEEKLWPT